MYPVKEEESLILVSNNTTSRKPPNSLFSAMRKYQQLLLAIVSVFSLAAFLFYKHEYDRLRYTLEYLEVFGDIPSTNSANSLCESGLTRKLRTSSPRFTTLNTDIALYSAFWEESSGVSKSKVRVLALIKNSFNLESEIESKLISEWFPAGVLAVCKPEILTQDNQKSSSSHIIYIICQSKVNLEKTPSLIKFRHGNKNWSSLLPIQMSENWKSVANISCACAFSANPFPISSLRLIEFISHHRNLGIEKFVFFGSLLTPLIRKVLDKYGEDVNLFYEEKSFDLPIDFIVTEEQIRLMLEKDCIYRHRDVYENVIVLSVNEFLVPRSKTSIQEVLTSVRREFTPATSMFSFILYNICIEDVHFSALQDGLLLERQSRSILQKNVSKISLVRPHLLENDFQFRSRGLSTPQRVPFATAVIHSFKVCPSSSHTDQDHLASNKKFAELVKTSLLYRKYRILS